MARKPASAKKAAPATTRRAKNDWKPDIHQIVSDYTLDTLHVSDLYRRDAWLREMPLATEIVETTRRIGALLTYLEPEGGESINKDTRERLRLSLRYLAILAQEAAAEKVILPTVKGSHSAEVLDELATAMKKGGQTNICMCSRKAPYELDLDNIGKIDTEKKTALDKGLRGLWEIDQKLWSGWDRQCNLV